jgi:hypothetical protein
VVVIVVEEGITARDYIEVWRYMLKPPKVRKMKLKLIESN